MSDIAQRISDVIIEKKINKRTLANKIGYSDVAIGKIISRKSKPKFELIESLVNIYPDLNPAWLLTGRGEMLLSEEKQSASELSGNENCQNCERLQEKIEMLEQLLEAKNETIRAYQSKENTTATPSKDRNSA